MIEIVFNNLSLDSETDDPTETLTDIMIDVLDHISASNKKLMKLKFFKMYLRSDHLVNSLCKIF